MHTAIARLKLADPLVLAALLITAEAFVRTLERGPTVLGTLALILAVFLAYFLIHRSRIAWLVALAAALGQIITLGAEVKVTWFLCSALIVLGCLLAPSTLAAIWRNAERSRRWALSDNLADLREAEFQGLGSLARGFQTLQVGFERLVLRAGGLGRLIVVLLLVILLLAPVVGVLADVDADAGNGNVPLGILWSFVWFLYTVLRIGFFVLLIAWVHQLVLRQRASSPRSKAVG